VETIVVDNAVFRLSIAWSVPEIFAIKVYSCPKSSALLITHEPLHLAWWNFARTCTLTASRTLLNFKVIGQRSRSHGFLVFLSVHDAAATRGQYLALSKAWRSCYAGFYVLCISVIFGIFSFGACYFVCQYQCSWFFDLMRPTYCYLSRSKTKKEVMFMLWCLLLLSARHLKKFMDGFWRNYVEE